MKKLITCINLLFIAVSVIAQADSVDTTKKEMSRTTAPDRVNASIYMGVGMGFSNLKSSPTAIATYIAPAISYQFTQRFKLNLRVIHYTITGNSFINYQLQDKQLATNKRSYEGNLIQLQGQYLMNERMVISGAVLYNAVNMRVAAQDNYKGATLGIDYKITPHTTFSIQTTVIQGNGQSCLPYSNYLFDPNPRIPTGIGSPFNTSPFHF